MTVLMFVADPFRFHQLFQILRALAALAFLAGTLYAEGPPPPASPSTSPSTSVRALEKRISEILEKTGTPGMIGAIVEGEQTLWLGALGIADRETNRPVTHDTRFRLGSISKMFVALAVLKCAERGQLALSDRVEQLIPEIVIDNPWADSHPVRLLHLLEHTSGLADLGPRGHTLDLPLASTRQAIELVSSSRRVRWQPGTRKAYSNLGPGLAALALENATGEPFEIIAEREIFAPLGMTKTSYDPHEDLAASYVRGIRAPYRHILKPSGGASATSRDMAQLLKMFLARGKLDGSPFLTSESIARMETPTSTLAAQAGLKAGYGLGNRTLQKKGFVYQGHGGGIEGFIAQLGYLPSHKRGYFLAINAANDAAFDAIDDEIAAFITQDLDAPKQVPLVSLTEQKLRAYAGTYLADAPASAMGQGMQRFGVHTVDFHQGQLLFDGSRLSPVGNGQFITGDNPLPSFVFLESPQGAMLLQSENQTWIRVNPLIAWGRSIALFVSLFVAATTLLFAPVWVVRTLFGKMRGVRHFSVRILPLLATLSLVAMVVLIRRPPGIALAHPTFWSVGFCLDSILFAALAVLALIHCVLSFPQHKEIGRLVWCHSLLASFALTIVALLLGEAGVIGLCTWTY